MYQRKIVSD